MIRLLSTPETPRATGRTAAYHVSTRRRHLLLLRLRRIPDDGNEVTSPAAAFSYGCCRVRPVCVAHTMRTRAHVNSASYPQRDAKRVADHGLCGEGVPGPAVVPVCSQVQCEQSRSRGKKKSATEAIDTDASRLRCCCTIVAIVICRLEVFLQLPRSDLVSSYWPIFF